MCLHEGVMHLTVGKKTIMQMISLIKENDGSHKILHDVKNHAEVNSVMPRICALPTCMRTLLIGMYTNRGYSMICQSSVGECLPRTHPSRGLNFVTHCLTTRNTSPACSYTMQKCLNRTEPFQYHYSESTCCFCFSILMNDDHCDSEQGRQEISMVPRSDE